ncbi:MAG TPA: hypothetical protein VL096_08475, partial [Pirellulaceae bacterium]|nr:hypothetical protein [Pirellulaceae bacterium]
MTTEATELPPEPPVENPAIGEESADIFPENNDTSRAAADELRQRFALHGFELADELQLAEVPGNVLAALMQALAAQPGPRTSETERREQLA